MANFDDLSRDSYRPDGAEKAAQQEADELSRAHFHPDANAKAAQQEAEERSEEQAARRRRTPSARADRDVSDHTVMRRTSDEEQAASGGAVISRRSGLEAALNRRAHKRKDSGAQRQREADRQRKAWEREQRRRQGGSHTGVKIVVGILVAIVAFYLVVCVPIDRAISFSPEESKGLSQEFSWHMPGTPYYVLALGSDAREGEEVSRSDTMILVRVDPLAGKLTMLSIPRDTKVEIEGYGTQKINAAYAFGGAAGAVHAVRELTGAPISQAAVIKFDGIENLVDYLGGITVNVPVDVYDPEYTGLELSAGEQEMDGHTAMLFSRVRHGFAEGDYQRQKDQRIVMQAIMGKALSLPPWEVPGLVGAMSGLLSTSMRMYSILPLMLRLKLGGATVYQATVPSYADMQDGVSYVFADEEALAETMRVIDAGGDPAELQE